jgi:hypothetical protein
MKICLRPCGYRAGLTRRAMNRFIHRIIMAVLLVAALAIIWNVLGSR